MAQIYTRPCKSDVVVVGNKVDLQDSRQITVEEGKEWASAHSGQFFEIRALMNPCRQLLRQTQKSQSGTHCC
jgi:hypothetical protein